MQYFFPFTASFILSLIFTLGIKKIALRFNIVDKPGERKIHRISTPLLGGIGVFLSFFSVLFFYSDRFLAGNLELRHLLGFFIGSLIIIIGGALDDKFNLSPSKQILFPALAIIAVIIGGVEIEKITNPLGGLIYLKDLIIVGPILIAAWLLGMMYTTKLLDGVDGLVTGVGAIGGFIIFLFTITTKYYQPDIALAALVLGGSALGFLVFNFHPAKIFLGEGGSLFIGFVLGVLAIISGGKIAITLLIMGIPILDVAWTIARRLLKGSNPFRFSDKKHLHHRFLSLGFNQRQTVLIFYLLSLTFGLSGLFLQSRGKILALMILALLMLLIIIAFGLFDKREKKSLKSKDSSDDKPSLLLHICCAPCSAFVSKELLIPKYKLTWFFYNPNLTDLEEYNKRLEAVRIVAQKFNIELIVIPYEHNSWLEKIKNHELDPEKGARCQICYFDRLNETAKFAKNNNFEYFGTSLLTSPYKDKDSINRIGKKLEEDSGVRFISEDFQANDGYRKSQEFAKELGLYRQRFCGCEFSTRG